MSQVYVGQLFYFGGNFAPRGFLTCSGQLLSISQNTALFAILGTNYGGNGTTTFGLPNLQGTVAVGDGQGPGLSSYRLGETTGSQTVTVLTTEMPAHNHAFVASTDSGDNFMAANRITAKGYVPAVGKSGAPKSTNFYSANPNLATTALAPLAISQAGGNQPHNNMQPFLAITICIATQGIYPPRP